MDNLNLITSDFVFSGNFDGCLPQKVGVSAPVLKRNGPVGTVHGGKNGGILRPKIHTEKKIGISRISSSIKNTDFYGRFLF